MKYIDADKLKAEIERELSAHDKVDHLDAFEVGKAWSRGHRQALEDILSFITSLQQEQPNDVCAEIKDYYGEDLSFDDERTKAAYHFFSAGKSFELKEIEKERAKHVTDLLDNYQKGKKAGYKEAISELKEGKIECSPDMKDFQQEQPSLPDNLDEAAEEYAYNNWEDNDYHTGASEGLLFDAIGHTEKCFKAGAEWMAGQMKQEQSEVDLEEEAKKYFQGLWPGTETTEQCNTDMHFTPLAILRMVDYFYKLGLKAKRNE